MRALGAFNEEDKYSPFCGMKLSDTETIRAIFGDSVYLENTLEKDIAVDTEGALIEVYKKNPSRRAGDG